MTVESSFSFDPTRPTNASQLQQTVLLGSRFAAFQASLYTLHVLIQITQHWPLVLRIHADHLWVGD